MIDKINIFRDVTQAQWLAIFEGAVMTVQLTVLAIVIGMVLGLFLALGRISKNKFANGLAWTYIWIFRGTPLLLQIVAIYYALPSLGINFSPYASAIIALSLNSGAYLAEIIRAGIVSIDKGQMEASKALGMSYYQAMFKVIIPQSYRRLIPPVGNEAIMLLKDSSLVSAIAMSELLRVNRTFASRSGNMIYFLVAAVIYLFFTTIFTYVFQKLEQKYSAYE